MGSGFIFSIYKIKVQESNNSGFDMKILLTLMKTNGTKSISNENF